MANCTCTGSTGSTYATVNRGYGCLSSVPTASSIPYNCFLPPTNMSYYQNYPFYNGPCGTVAGSSSGSGGGQSASGNCCCCCCPTTGGSQSVPSAPVQPSAPAAPNCCCCCCAPSGSSSDPGSVPSTPLTPAIPTGKCCFPWYYPWCCPTTSEEEEEEEDEDMSSTNCCFPWFCNPCCGAQQSVPSTPLLPPVCKPCKPNPCCQPAALIATSNGAFQPAVNGLVPLTLVNTLSSALSLMSDTITINCPGTYLITLSSNIPATSTYVGNASVALNGSPIATTTQTFANTTASQNTTQAIVKATKGSTLTITTNAAGSAQIQPTSGTNLFTISVVRIA